MKPRNVISILILLLSTVSFAKEDFRIVELKVSSSLKVRRIKLFVGRASNWTDTVIVSEMKKVNSIFSKCSVSFNKLLIADFESPQSVDLEDIRTLAKDLILQKKRSPMELAVVFIKHSKGDYKTVMGGGGISWGPALLKDEARRKMYANLIVMTDDPLTDVYKTQRAAEYSPLAHEIGHILLNSGHVHFKNLMADQTVLLDGSLSDMQCAEIKKSPLISK